MPEVVNGAMLVMEEVVWPDPRDAKNWPQFLRQADGSWRTWGVKTLRKSGN